jgi:putative thiamine transport system permease protein
LLRLVPGLTVLLFLGPVAAGLLGTLLPAFGYLPALGGDRLSLTPWQTLLAAPGLGRALALSLWTGLAAALLSFGLTVLAFATGHGAPAFRRARRAMTPLLAVPHLALAIGLAFLLAPSGWLARLISPWLTGWQSPPDLATVQDPLGLALILGLALKETPFLILMTFAALGQIRAEEHLRVARSLGYPPAQAWLKVVLPLAYPQLRLPLYAVLAYSLSVVDMAIVLAPNAPPPLAVMVLRWFLSAELALRFQAAAGACLQLFLVLGAILLWRGGEWLVGRLARAWLGSGRRGAGRPLRRALGWGLLAVLLALAAGSLLSLLVWSLAGSWRFPDAWPQALGLDLWTRQLDRLGAPLWTTLTTGLAATGLALLLVLGCLENERRTGRRPGAGVLTLIYVPLLVPQISFLFGVQIGLVGLGLDGRWPGLVWTHLLFVLPYVFLALADPYRSLDPRYGRSALALGKAPFTVWRRITLPMLLRPIAIAAAIGFAVSVAQYLPTQFAGAGRLRTLTTEALSLAAGGNRRVVGMIAFTLAALPLVGFALAQALPAWRFRDRQAMRIAP